jgi:hypothetical protein
MIIEHRTFRLAAGAGEAAFLAADERVQTEVAPFQHGFIRRTTARGTDGRWLVETLWYDDRCADGAAAGGAAVEGFDALVDPGSVHVERWTALA